MDDTAKFAICKPQDKEDEEEDNKCDIDKADITNALKVCEIVNDRLSRLDQQKADAINNKNKSLENGIAELITAPLDVYKQTLKFYSGIVDSLKADNDSSKANFQFKSSDQSLRQFQQSIQNCFNVSNVTQSNVIDVGNDCPALTGLPSIFSFSDIKQVNTTKIRQDCVTGSLINLLSQMDASIDTKTAMEAIQKASGFMTSNKDTQTNCGTYLVYMDACQYVSTNQCCINAVNFTQKNEIFAKCPSYFDKINQSNFSDVQQKCYLTSESAAIGSLATNMRDVTTMKTEQTASNDLFMIVLIVLFVVIVIGFGYVIKQGVTVAAYVIAACLFLAGPALITLYYCDTETLPSTRDERYVFDRPFFNAEKNSGIIYSKVSDSTTFKEAMLKTQDGFTDGAVKVKPIGFDFVIDQSSIQANTAPQPDRTAFNGDEWSFVHFNTEPQESPVGIAMYILEVPKQLPDIKSTSIGQRHSVSYIKREPTMYYKYPIAMVYGGAVSCVLSVVALVAATVVYYRKRPKVIPG